MVTVLAAANISAAMAGAADLAQVSSDSLVLNGQIKPWQKRVKWRSDRSHYCPKLQMGVRYNFIVLIPAALGYVPP
ncbi:MAG: hypothetical protein U1E91_01095 [Moraxella sp.]